MTEPEGVFGLGFQRKEEALPTSLLHTLLELVRFVFPCGSVGTLAIHSGLMVSVSLLIAC